ncbi:segregation and condensation protein A [Acetivibrio straminisolvens JCM 21531]|uniref:Segregation and condensation protein A n=1 Tax=Acetivibrio straminisolvens JCM 21531 TaxID=1294263 RepID=W4V6N1_9FIRM|nr:segregation and condensation protein A [Acetivibrio straminisolvens JCM 21531]
MIERNERKMNKNTGKMTQILQHEKVSLRSKIRDVIRTLLKKPIFKFSELFSPKTRSRLEIVTGFLAILELAKLKKITLIQPKQFADITVCKCENTNLEDIDEESIAAEN